MNLDPNAVIYIPYPRVNCLKTIPFTAAHTYIAHKWQYPPSFLIFFNVSNSVNSLALTEVSMTVNLGDSKLLKENPPTYFSIGNDRKS